MRVSRSTAVGYVFSAYASATDETGDLMVNRPCSLLGWMTLPGYDGATNVAGALIQLRDGTVTADIKLEFELGMAGSSYGSLQGRIGLGTEQMVIPGDGIRFDVGIFVKGESAPNRITYITVFYE